MSAILINIKKILICICKLVFICTDWLNNSGVNETIIKDIKSF